MKRFLWWLQAAGVYSASLPFSILPYKTGELFGLLMFHLWKSRRQIAIENVKKSSLRLGYSTTPETLIKENFKNLGRSLLEVLKIYHGKGNSIAEATIIKGADNFERAREKGKGVIIITGHCGNWELMGRVMSLKLANVAGVARPLDNPYLNRFIEKTRASYGNSVIYKKGALKGIMSTLKNGGNVVILMDQAVLPGNEGYVIEFLGRNAWTTRMPALIARKTGAAVVPLFISRSVNGHEINIHPAVELSQNSNYEEALVEDTKKLSAYIEDYIRQHPSEWLWIHKRWKRA